MKEYNQFNIVTLIGFHSLWTTMETKWYIGIHHQALAKQVIDQSIVLSLYCFGLVMGCMEGCKGQD